MAKKTDPEKVLKDWIERDLTAAAKAGELVPAFEVDDVLRRVADVLASRRHPVLSGAAGVGKSAIVHELVRRVTEGQGPPSLQGKRVLQISLRNRMSALMKPEEMRPEMQRLVEVLLALSGEVVPFFRDMHLAYTFDLEPQLQLLGMRFRGPILGEAEAKTFDAMIEGTPELDQFYLALPLAEPDLPAMERILVGWSAEQARTGRPFDAGALSEALQLSHRFLARSNQPRKTIDFLSQVKSLVPEGTTVGAHDVIDRFFQSYKVPRFLIDPDVPFDMDATERLFRSRVLGQAEAVRTFVRMISLIKAGLSDTRRPFGAFLFVGPTGVGKTHIAQLLAEYLFGGRDRMVRINMADYQAPNDANVLFGNPDGYNVRQRRGALTLRLMGHPFAVLLLDEFEKAHSDVHDRFLQLVDEGAFINGAGETVPCRSLIVIATSNAGAEVYRGRAIGFANPADVAEMDRELDRLLYKHFRVEFLNRFDQIVHFHPLTREDIRTIALREIEQLRERAGLKNRGFSLEIDEGVLDWLTAHGYDPHFGARFLRRAIERNVTTAIAEAVVRENLEPGTRIALTVRAGRVVATVVANRPRDEKPKAEAVRLPQGKGEKVHSLDRKTLVAEADALLARAAPELRMLDESREEASALLARMNEEGFWAEPVAAQDVLERFRALDVAIQMGARFAEPLLRLPELRELALSRPTHVTPLARGLEAAAKALRQWEDRRAEEGPSSVWLLLRNVDPLDDAAEWLTELVAMEIAWSRRLHLAAEVIAYGVTDDVVSRVVLEVEGPGAASYLRMEEGVHRLHRAGGSDLRVRMDLVPKRERERAGNGNGNGTKRATSVRPKTGHFGLEVAATGRAEWPARGVVLELVAANVGTLAHFLADFERAQAALGGQGGHGGPSAPSAQRDGAAEVGDAGRGMEAARSYAHAGSGARDPRTGVVIPRYKDVLKGKLDPLLEGWRRLSP